MGAEDREIYLDRQVRTGGVVDRRAQRVVAELRELAQPLVDGPILALAGISVRGAMRVARANVRQTIEYAAERDGSEILGLPAPTPPSIIHTADTDGRFGGSLLAALTADRLYVFGTGMRRRALGFGGMKTVIERTVADWNRAELTVEFGNDTGVWTVDIAVPSEGQAHRFELPRGLGAARSADEFVAALGGPAHPPAD